MSSSFGIIWISLALRDLKQLARYIGQDDKEAAQKVLEHIRNAGQSLCRAPERGRPGRVPGTRELILTGLPYYIVYRVRGEKVQIIRVLHTARQWQPN